MTASGTFGGVSAMPAPPAAPDLVHHEIEILRMLNGEVEYAWGAWISACLEVLVARGYSTAFPHYQITDKGRAALQELRS